MEMNVFQTTIEHAIRVIVEAFVPIMERDRKVLVIGLELTALGNDAVKWDKKFVYLLFRKTLGNMQVFYGRAKDYFDSAEAVQSWQAVRPSEHGHFALAMYEAEMLTRAGLGAELSARFMELGHPKLMTVRLPQYIREGEAITVTFINDKVA